MAQHLNLWIDLRGRRSYSRWLVAGAAFGTLSAVVVHQGAFALLDSAWLLATWGALWGALLAATLGRLDGARLVLSAAAFGAVLPTLVTFVIVAPLRGQPTVTGVVPLALIGTVVLNAAWGLATGMGLAFFGRPRIRRE